MENATKALMMGASVLVAMLVIGAVVMMFNSMSASQQQASQSTQVEQITEYNKQFEKYNVKILYGSDILSIANLIDDYNTRNVDDGYVRMTSTVNITSAVSYKNSNNVIVGISTPGSYSIQDIRKYFVEKTDTKAVNKQIELLEEKYSKLNIELSEIYKNYQIYMKNQTSVETQYEKTIKSNNTLNITRVNADMNDYENYQALLTEFKSKVFTCTGVEYDQLNNRIIEMNFKQASA